MRRPDLLVPVFHAEVGGSAHRQIARQLGVSHSTVQRLMDRLGRHCLLLHETLRARAVGRLATEAVVMDGLVSFAGGQYWPVEITGLIGATSYYSHDFVVTERRRAGTMTAEQKHRRRRYERRFGRPPPGALTRDVLDLLSATLPPQRHVELRTDEKVEYRTALRRLGSPRIAHRTTHSRAPRTPRNPLFSVNAHHLVVRHSGANHKRETVAFSKRIQAVIHRHAIFQVWKNLVKSASERQPRTTPAQRLGVTDRRWTVAEVLGMRLFAKRIPLRARSDAYYRGAVRSRFVSPETRHERRFAT